MGIYYFKISMAYMTLAGLLCVPLTGLCTAAYLLRQGLRPLLIDEGEAPGPVSALPPEAKHSMYVAICPSVN